jgi:hypothetical protein
MKTDIILGGFRKRHLPINVDYRPMYKIGLIIIILTKVCIGNKSSLTKLHFFIWALKSKKNMEFIKNVIESGITSDIISWGVEPALNKALGFGVAEELFALHDDKYALTKTGIELSKKIEKEPDLFIDEKIFLEFIGKRKVTEAFMDQLTSNLSN